MILFGHPWSVNLIQKKNDASVDVNNNLAPQNQIFPLHFKAEVTIKAKLQSEARLRAGAGYSGRIF